MNRGSRDFDRETPDPLSPVRQVLDALDDVEVLVLRKSLGRGPQNRRSGSFLHECVLLDVTCGRDPLEGAAPRRQLRDDPSAALRSADR